jgi:hypothetical protein
VGRDEVGGDVHDFRFDPQCLGDRRVDLVPGQDLVRRDVERLADGGLKAEQAVETAREIAMVGQRPEGRSVTVHDHLFSAAEKRELNMILYVPSLWVRWMTSGPMRMIRPFSF